MKCVFSGNFVKSEDDKEKRLTYYYYEQKNLVPTYLIVLAAGDIEYAKITDRTGVWAEKEILNKATYEFANTDLFIKKVNKGLYLRSSAKSIINLLSHFYLYSFRLKST